MAAARKTGVPQGDRSMSLTSGREPFVSREVLHRVVLAWALVALIMVLRDLPAIRAMRFSDPDDSLRLTQVRDLIAGQGWFDLHQYRIDPPHGVLMHWSRLVDLPIAAFILLLRPLLGVAAAEQTAAVIVPLLTLFVAQLLAGRIAWKLFGTQIAWLACLCWILAFPAMSQLDPLRIDHHGWQIVAVLAAVNGLIARNARSGGVLAGAALAFGMAISLELLPFTALFAAIFGLRWLGDARQRIWLVTMLQALALTSAVLFVGTHGMADLANHCDSISPAYLAAFATAAILVSGIAALPPLSRSALIALLGVAAIAAVGAALAVAPQCTTGPFAQLDPLVRRYWYNNVLEGRPVWHQDFATMVQIVVPPLIGVGTMALITLRAKLAERQQVLEFGLLLLGTLVIAAAVARFGGVACALATIPTGWMLRHSLDRINTFKSPLAKVASLIGLLAMMVPGIAVIGVQNFGNSFTAKSNEAQGNETTAARYACGMPGSLAFLDTLPTSTIFAPLDIGPSILNGTKHSVVATGHHRASAAMHDIIAAFMASPDEARTIVQKHRASYVIACPDLTETTNYSTTAKAGLTAQLLAGKVPAWLEPVALPTSAGTLKLWRVRS